MTLPRELLATFGGAKVAWRAGASRAIRGADGATALPVACYRMYTGGTMKAYAITSMRAMMPPRA